MSNHACTLDAYSPAGRAVYVDTARGGKLHTVFDGEKVFTVRSLIEIHAEDVYIDVLHPEIYREVLEILKRGVRVYLLREIGLIKKIREEKRMEKNDENDAIALSQIPPRYFRPLSVKEMERKIRLNSLVNYYANLVRLKKTLSQWLANSRVWMNSLKDVGEYIPWTGVLEKVNLLREPLSNSIKILEEYIKELAKIVVEEAEKTEVYGEVLRRIGLSSSISFALQILRLQTIKDPRSVSVASLTGLYGYRPASINGRYDHRLRELNKNLALQLYSLARSGSLKETSSNKKIIEMALGMDRCNAVYRIGRELVKIIAEACQEVYSGGAGRNGDSVGKSIKIPRCTVCGDIGVDLGKVEKKDVALCLDCARKLLPRMRKLLKAASRVQGGGM
jgi:hypothetical protein